MGNIQRPHLISLNLPLTNHGQNYIQSTLSTCLFCTNIDIYTSYSLPHFFLPKFLEVKNDPITKASSYNHFTCMIVGGRAFLRMCPKSSVNNLWCNDPLLSWDILGVTSHYLTIDPKFLVHLKIFRSGWFGFLTVDT